MSSLAAIRMFSLLSIVALAQFGGASAQPSPPSATARGTIDYDSPGTLVHIAGGRTMHLRCAGTGSPTVIFIPGLGDSTIVWHLVQPRIVSMTRTCAWDRAGFGFSGPSPNNQTAIERAHDLELTLKAAGIRGPYVIVSHSLGSYESLIFADQHRHQLDGMVLVDPAIPDQQRRLSRVAPAYHTHESDNWEQSVAAAKRCEIAMLGETLNPSDPDPDNCFHYDVYYSPELTAKLAQLDSDPTRVETQLSLYANDATTADGRSAAVFNSKRNYGDLPLIVLSAGSPFSAPANSSAAVTAQAAIEQAEWIKAHVEMAGLSSRGVHRIVPNARHAIQLMQPDAVVQAIIDVLSAKRAQSKPS